MYLALYRKYRPRTFDDVISQEHITTTLKNQLKNGQSSHAYLFTGSRGTGKTTCAKILAKALNCTDLKDGNPCLECDSCKSIDEDYSDITEIDAASNNGVDDVRDLKEESFYAPMSGKYKVYIIDEVHMLSIQAFNALLKLIEEPPAHVVFILATTEVHKVPATILSRCQRFEFRRIDINDSKKRLMHVAELEGKTLTDDAAFLISKTSEGGMRDALSLLDQCFSVSDNVDAETVRQCAGISGSDYLFRIADLINDKNSAELMKVLDELIDKSKDVTRLCEELIRHFRSLMLIKAGSDNSVIRATSDDLEKYNCQAEKFTLEQILRCIDILNDTFSSMGRVRTPSLLLEMCFIRLCSPKLDTDERSLLDRISRLEQLISSGNFSAAANNSNDDKKEVKKAADNKIPVSVSSQKVKENKENSAALSSEGASPLSVWREIVDTLPDSIQYNIGNTTASIKDNTIIIYGGELAVQMAVSDYRQQVQEAASRVIGRNVNIISYKDVKEENISSGQNKINKVKSFLDLAGSRGVTIKIQ